MAPDLVLDDVHSRDPLEHCFRYRRLVRFVQIVERPTNMRHTGGFVHPPTFINRIVSCVSIRLQRACELAQVSFRMLALAIRRIAEPHRWGTRIAPGRVIPYVGP
jgi:hypothetical protein